MRSPRSTDYVLGRRLGSGAFGSVYAAVDQRSKQRVVLKQIPIHGVAQKEKADALNEVQLMARISHAHVVRYSASFVEDEGLRTASVSSGTETAEENEAQSKFIPGDAVGPIWSAGRMTA